MCRKLIATLMAATLIFGILAFEADAEGSHGKGGYGKGKGCHGSLEGKFSHKAHLILKNAEELGLTDKQVEKIKELKIDVKKDLIRKNADLEILAIDIKAGLWKDRVDTDEINKLVDQKYDIKKEKTKSIIGAYAALKGIMTKAQKEKMKELWKRCKKSE